MRLEQRDRRLLNYKPSIAMKTFHIQQQGQADCGVACLKAALRLFGGNASLERIRELSGTAQTGTTLLGLLQGAKALGMEAEGYEADIISLQDCKELCILHVMMDHQLQHFVLCYGYDETKAQFKIGDPAKAVIEYWGVNQLEEVWKSKSLLMLKPTDQIVEVRHQQLDQWKWLVHFVKEDLNLLGLALALGLGIAILGLSTAIFSQKLLDDILPAKSSEKLIMGVLLLFFLLLVKSGFSYLRQFFLLKQSKDFNIRIIDYFYNALLHLPKSFFDSRKTGELIARMNDTSRIQRTISTVTSNSMIDLLLLLVATVAIFWYNGYLGWIALLWIPIYGWIVYRFHPRIVKGHREVMESYAKNESNYVDTIQGIGVIKVNNKQSIFSRITKNIYGFFQYRIFELGKISIQFSFFTEAFAGIFISTIILISSLQVLNGNLSIGGVMAILQMVGMMMGAASSLALLNIHLQEAKIAFDRMYEFTHLQDEYTSELEGSKSIISPLEELRVKDLSFRFPGRKRLLQQLDFSIRKGEIIAVLGESGSGKSTLLQILQKFYTTEAGSIKVNGIDLDLVSTVNWRKQLGVVPQQIKLFSGNLIDNILLGDQVEDLTLLEAFFQNYGFDQYFCKFPNGYATLLGEQGVNISGGQKQLVGLARALWKKPSLLLLDEPTAALDRDSEHFVLALLEKLKSELGVLLLTHRISTAKNADRIYILENGSIEQYGNHFELLESDNLYSRAWGDLIDFKPFAKI